MQATKSTSPYIWDGAKVFGAFALASAVGLAVKKTLFNAISSTYQLAVGNGGMTIPTAAGLLSGTATVLSYKARTHVEENLPEKLLNHTTSFHLLAMGTSSFALTTLGIGLTSKVLGGPSVSIRKSFGYGTLAALTSVVGVAAAETFNRLYMQGNFNINDNEPLIDKTKKRFYAICETAKSFYDYATETRIENIVNEYHYPASLKKSLLDAWSCFESKPQKEKNKEDHLDAYEENKGVQEDGYVPNQHIPFNNLEETWKDAAKVGVGAALVTGVTIFVTMFALRTIAAYGRTFPGASSILPTAMIMAPTFVAAKQLDLEHKHNKEFYSSEGKVYSHEWLEKVHLDYEWAKKTAENEWFVEAVPYIAACAAGTVLTPLVTALFMQKSVTFGTALGTSVAGAALTFFYEHVNVYYDYQMILKND